MHILIMQYIKFLLSKAFVFIKHYVISRFHTYTYPLDKSGIARFIKPSTIRFEVKIHSIQLIKQNSHFITNSLFPQTLGHCLRGFA